MEMTRYEDVCPVCAERQPDLHTSAEGLQLSDPVSFNHGGAILLAYSACPFCWLCLQILGSCLRGFWQFLTSWQILVSSAWKAALLVVLTLAGFLWQYEMAKLLHPQGWVVSSNLSCLVVSWVCFLHFKLPPWQWEMRKPFLSRCCLNRGYHRIFLISHTESYISYLFFIAHWEQQSEKCMVSFSL